jgi:nucleoside-diphosphate-sugar epimerase
MMINNIVCVVGGSGFIGSRLCERLKHSDVKFSILDRVKSSQFPVDHIAVDIRDIDRLRCSIKSDSLIINLAAEHRDDISPKTLYDDVNVRGARNLCVIANEMMVNKIIFTSSVAV